MQTEVTRKKENVPKWGNSSSERYFEPQILPNMIAVFYDYQTGKLHREVGKPLLVFSKTCRSDDDGIDFIGWTCMVESNGDLHYLKDDGNFIGLAPKDASIFEIEEIHLAGEIEKFKKTYSVRLKN
jgi:hypothetical protein